MKKSFKLSGLVIFSLLVLSCKGKNSTNSNTMPPPENIINLDLSIPGTFGAIYLYSPSILCNRTVIIGSAILTCEFYEESLIFPPPQIFAYSSAYTIDLAASIANACSITGISPETSFTSTPFISAGCAPGTAITCTASGVEPLRSATISAICPT